MRRWYCRKRVLPSTAPAPALAARDRSFLIQRTRTSLRDLSPAEGGGGGGAGARLISILLKNAPAEARGDCERFLAAGGPERIYGVTEALEGHRPAWAAQLLKRRLDDERVLDPDSRWRVRDAAASSLQRLNPRFRFKSDAPLAARDRQIAAIARTLARGAAK